MSASSWMDIADGSLSITSGQGASAATAKANEQAGAPAGMPGSDRFDGDMPRGGMPAGEPGALPTQEGDDSGPTPPGGPGQGATPPSGTTPPAAPEGGIGAPQDMTPPTTAPSGETAPATSGATDASIASDEESASTKGLKAGGALTVRGGTLSIDAADDALHSHSDLTVSGGELALASGDDGVHADCTLTVSGGTTTISTCYEGLGGAQVEFAGGTTDLTATDDGPNASDSAGSQPADSNASAASSECSISISGGVLSITASGDAIDSNDSLEITGGTITWRDLSKAIHLSWTLILSALSQAAHSWAQERLRWFKP